MIQGITKQEFIEILDKKLDQKLDTKFAQFELSLMKRIDKKIDDKIDAFAVLVRNSFQSIEDRMATKEDLKKLEVRLDSKFDKVLINLDKKIESFQKSTNRKLNWFL